MPTMTLTTTPDQTAPAELTVENGGLTQRDGFPTQPIYDEVTAALGDPTLHPCLSMRALAEARLAPEGGDVDERVWLFDRDE
jgi:hypothetical protein